MGDKSRIEWTDATWNPVTGCAKVSPGCDHCYAETLAERFRGTPGHYFEHGFEVQLRPDKLDQPLRWTKPRRIFVNSMSDLFHDQVPDQYIAQVFAVMALARQHTFQILTKRHARMRSLLSSPAFWHLVAAQGREHFAGDQHGWLAVGAMFNGTPLPHVWLGVSVEDQKWADIRVPALLKTPAAVRFVSCEPLLGPVDLRSIPYRGDADYLIDSLCRQYRSLGTEATDGKPCTPFSFGMANLGGVDWVIAGGESGRDARPMHPDWARSLRDQCRAAGVPFLFKQWGEWISRDHAEKVVGADYVSNARPESYTVLDEESMHRVGKKAAGRKLDGRTWDGFPGMRQTGRAS